jgi:Ca2+-transporting ATPase
MTDWYQRETDDVLHELATSFELGLTSAEAERRLEQHGLNELQAAAHISPWHILFQQFKNVLIVILLIATLLSAFLGHGIEAVAIAVIVLFAVLLGFVQEFRAEKADGYCLARWRGSRAAGPRRGSRRRHLPARRRQDSGRRASAGGHQSPG